MNSKYLVSGIWYLVMHKIFVLGRKFKTSNQQPATSNHMPGFTLIELLIVLVLFGLATSLITASYVTFERNQRVKTAAQNLKNDVRLAQNYGSTGYKGLGGVATDKCDSTRTLEGWYIKLSKNGTGYTIGGACYFYNAGTGTKTYDPPFGVKNYSFPKGVTVLSVDCAPQACSIDDPTYSAYILFETATNRTFIGSFATADFSNLSTETYAKNTATITVVGSAGSQYKIVIEGTSGDVYEKK